jgi:hypothetical protein
MLDSLRDLSDVQRGESLLLGAADLAAARARRQLLAQARRRAQECVAQAQEEAQQVRRAAYREGYLDGMLHAGGELAQVLLAEQGVGARVRRDAVGQVKAMLDELLLSEDWTQVLLQRWLADLEEMPGQTLHLLLPVQCKASHASLRTRLQSDWAGAIHVEYHADERFVFRVDDHLLELDVPVLGEKLAPRLASQLSALRDGVKTLDEVGRETLKNWMERIIGAAAANTEQDPQ